MRFYWLQIFAPGATTPYRTWTSHPNGVLDPGALNIEVDAITAPAALPGGAATVSVHGVSLNDLRQAYTWGMGGGDTTQGAGYTLKLYAGMAKGLPLANPNQAGLILQGMVMQAFGNWEGTEMAIEFVVSAPAYTPENPGNFVLNWRAGTSLSSALADCLSIAYPKVPQSINLSPDLVLSHDQIDAKTTLEGLGIWLRDFTQSQFNNPVYVGMQAGAIVAWDDTHTPAPKSIAFTDLVGQPTWIDVLTMQIKLVMRADIAMGDVVTLPEGLQSNPGIVLTQQAAAPSQLKYQSTFTGSFIVQQVRQVGNYRTPDGSAWVTIINCLLNA